MDDEGPARPRTKTARDLARNLLREAEIMVPPVLIRDVVRCLRKTRTINVDAWDLGSTSGIQVAEGETTHIAYNEAHHRHRKRFTVAHEIGHLLLGHTHVDGGVGQLEEGGSEHEADQFAAELLMPRDMLKKDVAEGLKDPNNLAARYDVSKQAMWVRITQCGQLNRL